MPGAMHRQLYLPVLFVLLIITGPVQAQEKAEATPEVAESVSAEESEASSDLRDSIHENLETIHEDAETAESLKEEQAEDLAVEQGVQGAPGIEPDVRAAETIPAVPEKKSTIDYIQSIPGYLQSVPEKVPFIRERGLIFFGRMEFDYAHYTSGITSRDSGFRVRSMRAGLAKAFEHNISVKAEVDFTDGDSNFSDLYARYRHKTYGLFTVGNQKVAQTLVNQTSRISRTFMEEPLPAEAFGLGRRLALGWDLHKPKGGLHTTLFGPDLNGSIGDYGYAGRIYVNPTRERFSVFHIGSSFVSESMSRKTRFFSHPESRVTNRRLVDTGIFEDVSEQRITAFEVAGAKESFMFRSEFFRAAWDRDTAKDPVFKGFYVQASLALTGEDYKYTQGKFLRLRPQNPRGAWEAAVRFSRIDLNDQGVLGGIEKNLSFAVNWYSPGNQFRVMSNVIFVRADEHAGDESPTIIQLRAQFHW